VSRDRLAALGQELVRVHDRLREDLDRLREAAVSGRPESGGARAARLVGELDGLSATLESHFTFEEHRIVQALGALRTEAPAAELLGVDPAF
jgi:hypothetical protein